MTRLQRIVLAELRKWPDGQTADELAILCQLAPRPTELKRAGKVVATGERRTNESGFTASVWSA